MPDTLKEYDKLSASEKKKEDWMNSKWRPMMGWMYMGICLFDFLVAPILWSLLQALANHGAVNSQWQPLTLQGAGLFHLAMGAVLGIAAYGRTQEKLNGANNGGLTPGGLSSPLGGSPLGGSTMPMSPRPMSPMSPSSIPASTSTTVSETITTTPAVPTLKPLGPGPVMNMPER
jgi:hypothetical protein